MDESGLTNLFYELFEIKSSRTWNGVRGRG
jgi:hypothetical protein